MEHPYYLPLSIKLFQGKSRIPGFKTLILNNKDISLPPHQVARQMMSYELGYTWLTALFDPETKEKARRKYSLLILKSYGSHVTIKFINFCNINKILLAIYLLHSIYSL